MATIVFIGAGSTVFTRKLIGDLLRFPELAGSNIVLHDIDVRRLETSELVARRAAEVIGGSPTIRTTTDRRAALDGADYAICLIQVGGYEPATLIDFEVPKRYGLRQTIADTLGIGGVMRGLRTLPVLLDMCRDMEELCPDVTFLNYVNPMAINCWAIDRASSIRTIGLCHSVPRTAGELATDLGLPAEELTYLVAGINHMAFFLRLEHEGRDLYPALFDVIRQGRVPPQNRVRYDMLTRLGYFVTESSEHFAEYVPWYIKQERPELIDRYNIPLDEYPRRCRDQIADWEQLRQRLVAGDEPPQPEQSEEYGPLIIHSMETGQPRVIYGNVPNRGLVDNLPPGCCVEVPCLVDANGVQPVRVAALPPQLAALMQTNINVQALTVEAALTGRRDHIYHAAMLDPHTASELTLDEIWALVDDLINAHGSWLPQFAAHST